MVNSADVAHSPFLFSLAGSHDPILETVILFSPAFSLLFCVCVCVCQGLLEMVVWGDGHSTKNPSEPSARTAMSIRVLCTQVCGTWKRLLRSSSLFSWPPDCFGGDSCMSLHALPLFHAQRVRVLSQNEMKISRACGLFFFLLPFSVCLCRVSI